MNIGFAEAIIMTITVALIFVIPLVVIGAGFLFVRRIKALESRVEKLESGEDAGVDKTP